MSKKQLRLISFCFIVAAFVLISLFVLFDRIPFPGDFMRAWYEPWRSETIVNGVPTIPHKAVGHDVFRQIYPFKALSVDLLKKGIIPFWNPYNGAGEPLLANGVNGVMNPFMLPFVLVNPKVAWTILYIGQFVVIALSYLLFVSSIGISVPAAVISCFILLGSSFVIANSLFSTFLYSFAGLPFLLWCLQEIKSGRPKGWYLFPLGVAWTVLTGFPQLIMYIFLMVIAYGLFLFWHPRLLGRIALLGVLGLGISGIQLLPMYELYRLSAITTESSSFIFKTFLMPLSHLISVLIPNFFGNPSTYNYWGYADYVETAVTVGSIAAFFVLVGGVGADKRKKSTRHFFIGVCIIGILLTLRWVGTEWLYRLPIPVLTTGVPSRSLGLVTFALSVLSAFGIDAFIFTQKKKYFYWLMGVLWIVMASIAGVSLFFSQAHVICNNPVITSCYSVTFRNTTLELVVFTLAIILLIINKLSRKNIGRFAIIGLGFVVLGSGMYNAYKFIPLMQTSELMPKHPILTELGLYGWDRVGYQGSYIPTDLATYYRFYDTNYYNPLYIKRYGELVSYVNTGSRLKGLTRSDVNVVSDATVSADISFRRERFWDMTGTSVLVTKKENQWVVSKRETSLPRAYIVNHLDIEPDPSRELDTMFSPETDLTKTAFVDASLLLVPEKVEEKGSVRIDSYEPSRVVMTSNSPTEAFLVLSDTYYPGWKAMVDGKETHVYRTNYAFRGVVVPEGKHIIRFTYDSASWKWGVGISIFSLVLWALMNVWYNLHYEEKERNA